MTIKLSITGADDLVSIPMLCALAFQYPQTEFGLLYLPEKEGAPRNPLKQWRMDFLKNMPKENTAIHLCGKIAFDEILSNDFVLSDYYFELKRYSRIQLNINSRADLFTTEQIHAVYDKLLQNNFNIILQYNPKSAQWIEPYLSGQNYSKQVSILLDASLGKGVAVDNFDVPRHLAEQGYFIGFAGGINPENISKIHELVKSYNIENYWLDLESGVRVDNQFSQAQARKLCALMFD